jgi:hypothetical protein
LSSFFVDDPRYNGSHICPKCGAHSQWHGIEAASRLVRVECPGPCGTYDETYSGLSDLPYFSQNKST